MDKLIFEVEYKNWLIIRLKAIKYYKKLFYYLFFSINFLVLNYYSKFLIESRF